jgi:hypothetical protein
MTLIAIHFIQGYKTTRVLTKILVLGLMPKTVIAIVKPTIGS